MLGTNPIAFDAQSIEGDDFILDMATTAVAARKVLSLRSKVNLFS